jgi:hypothetical protein
VIVHCLNSLPIEKNANAHIMGTREFARLDSIYSEAIVVTAADVQHIPLCFHGMVRRPACFWGSNANQRVAKKAEQPRVGGTQHATVCRSHGGWQTSCSRRRGCTSSGQGKLDDQTVQVGSQAGRGARCARSSDVRGDFDVHGNSGNRNHSIHETGRTAAPGAADYACIFNHNGVINAGETHHDEVQTRVHLA